MNTWVIAWLITWLNSGLPDITSSRYPLSKKLIMLITLESYLRIYYLLNSYFLIYLCIKDLRSSAIRCPSSRPLLGTLLLFYCLIKSSNILGVSLSHDNKDEGLSGIVFVTRLILIGRLKAMIFLGKWDVTGSTISYT